MITFVVVAYCFVVVAAYIFIMAWLSRQALKKLFVELWQSLFRKEKKEQTVYKVRKPVTKPHPTDDF